LIFATKECAIAGAERTFGRCARGCRAAVADATGVHGAVASNRPTATITAVNVVIARRDRVRL
jgi:hypothetical protein